MEYITIGKISKAQGLKGEVKINPFTNDNSRFLKLKVIYLDNTPVKIENVRVIGGVFFKLANINDRNAAELLVGKDVQIDKVNAITLPEDSYFIEDIVGCAFKLKKGKEEKAIGFITDVNSFGAADVFTVRTADNKNIRFPFLKKLIVKISVADKIFIADEERFEEVAVYED